MIQPEEFTTNSIRNGKFRQVLPELYEVEDIIQNDKGHINDPVLEHQLVSAEALQTILTEF